MSIRSEHEHPHDHGHGHGHGHAHGHLHGRDRSRRALALSLALTVAYGLFQVVAGIIFNSLALVADAAHNISDGGAIAIALLAAWAAGLPVRGAVTFGWKRIEVLAALVNGLALIAIGGWILYEAATRIADPEPVGAAGVAVVGIVGVFANGVPVVMMLRAGRGRDDINLRGAMIHAAADVLGSAGAALSGVLMLAFGWSRADPIIAAIIGMVVMASSWGLTRDAVRILLEIAPRGATPDAVAATITAVDGVVEVHDLHVWLITSGFPALSAHVTIDSEAERARVSDEIRRRLAEDHGITHVTVQVEHAPPALIDIQPRLTRGSGQASDNA